MEINEFEFYKKSIDKFKLKLEKEKDPYYISKEKMIQISQSSFFGPSTIWNTKGEGYNPFNLKEDIDDPNKFSFGYGNDSEGIIFSYWYLIFCGHLRRKGWSEGDKEDQGVWKYINPVNDESIYYSHFKFKNNLWYKQYWGNRIWYDHGYFHFHDKKINSLLLDFYSEYENELKRIKLNHEKEKVSKQNKLNLDKSKLISELDKDGNGVIDVIEGSDDFDKLFKKNQKKIIENDKSHIQQFVKISKYLRTKRNNIQETFTLITNSPKQESFDDLVGMLKNQIHTYEILVFNSLTMIVSLIEDDLITFYEIYELFDELNIFNSSFQNQISDNLTEMNYKLGDLMYSIDSMERNIVKGFKNLSYDLEGIKISLDTNLKGIQSSLDIGNFINKFPNYPTYKLRNEYSKIPGLDFGGGV